MATWAKGIDFKNSGNTARIGGIGVYGTDTKSEKIYIGLGAEPWSNNGLQLTSSTINFKGNKIYHAGDKPTVAEIGAAASSHTHSYLPLSGGTITNANFGPLIIERSGSANGSAIYFKNSNGILGAIGMSNSANSGLQRWTADTATYYTILDAGNYKSIVTPENIGAAASSHTHNYLPLSGGSLTGPVNNNYSTETYLAGNQGKTLINSTCGAGAYTMLYKYPSTNGYFTIGGYQGDFLLQYTTKTKVDAGTNSVTKSVTLLNESGESSFPGKVTASSFNGNLSGNASTATTLQTARTINGTNFNGSQNITTSQWGVGRNIKIGNTTKSVNGSADVSWSIDEIGAIPNSKITVSQTAPSSPSAGDLWISW